MNKKQQLRSDATDNLSRARNLVDIYEKHLLGVGKGRRPVASTDILRASVVFLHATLEDFLRGLAEWKLPEASQDTLNKIPLIGQKNGRAEKFFLGHLAKHRSKTVGQLFKDSVSSYLEQSNYNNIGEIRTLFEDISINPDDVSSKFNDIGRLMARRHHIVHRVDKNDQPGQGHHHAKPINHGNVRQWINVVDEFIDEVLDRI